MEKENINIEKIIEREINRLSSDILSISFSIFNSMIITGETVKKYCKLFSPLKYFIIYNNSNTRFEFMHHKEKHIFWVDLERDKNTLIKELIDFFKTFHFNIEILEWVNKKLQKYNKLLVKKLLKYERKYN